MPLTPEQQAQLEQLQEEAKKPEPRTESGVAGVLHTLLDIASGAVAHLGADVWAGLHSTVEKELGAQDAAGQQDQADSPGDPGSSSSSSSSSDPGGKQDQAAGNGKGKQAGSK